MLDDMKSTFTNKLGNLYFSLHKPKVINNQPFAGIPSNLWEKSAIP